MFSGPMFRWEYKATSRRRRPILVRTFMAATIGIVTLLIGLTIATAASNDTSPSKFILFGRASFIATFCFELLFLLFLVPGFVGASIPEERERNTLPLLLLTHLTPFEIVLTKTVARWLGLLNLILTGVPILVISAWAASLEIELALGLLVLLSSSAFMAALAICASSLHETVASARAQAMSWITFWLILVPFMTIIPVSTATLWGMLIVEVKALCIVIAPSSPASLVTDRRWYTQPKIFSLEEQVAWMIGLQAVFGLLLIWLASTRLKAREANPNWTDPTRGYRPPCGDDPIFWREYELPARRGEGSVIGLRLRLRFLWILIRAIALNVGHLLGTLIALAVPVGLAAATAYYAFGAFQEAYEYGYGSIEPFVERQHFNLLVRAATGALGLLPLINVSSQLPARIATERDKKTWDSLLATPLTGDEILGSKTRVCLTALRESVAPLVVVWVLGVAAGVVQPLGVLYAAIDLALAAWLFLALGLYLSLRPGRSSSTQSQIALSSLILLLIHGLALAAVLASPHELKLFAASGVWLRCGVGISLVMIPVLSGLAAWGMTLRTRERFDEWVGRPVLKPSAKAGV